MIILINNKDRVNKIYKTNVTVSLSGFSHFVYNFEFCSTTTSFHTHHTNTFVLKWWWWVCREPGPTTTTAVMLVKIIADTLKKENMNN